MSLNISQEINWKELFYDLDSDYVRYANDDFIHQNHIKYEKPIFDILKERYMEFFCKWWKTYQLPIINQTDKAIVLYETRCHENLEFIIYNATYFCRDWALIIYCSEENYKMILQILGHNKLRAIIHVVRFNDEGYKSERDCYNYFMKHPALWNTLPCKYVLLIEMDAYLRRHVSLELIKYEYVCCKFPWNNIIAGGGGLSIRNVESMKRICNEMPVMIKHIWGQDCWVAEGCLVLNMKTNNTYFAEGNHFITNPIGLHQWWTYVRPDILDMFSDTYNNYITLDIDGDS